MSCISIRPEELGTKEHLNEGERGEWKNCLKTQHSKYEEHGIQSHQFMADRWGKCGNSNRFYFLASEITAYGYCSNEIKRCLLTERNTITNLDCLLKRHHFSDKSPFSQSYGFSSGHVWMWELDHKESWALKNRRFQTVALEKTLERPLDCKIKSVNQNIQEINPEYSLEGLMLKLKLQYFGRLLQRAYSLEKTLLLGKIEGGRRRGRQRMGSLDSIITNSLSMSFSKLPETVRKREAYRAVHGVTKSRTRLRD